MGHSIAAVARVAYLASDLIIDSQPARPASSPFSKTYAALSFPSIKRPNIISAPLESDSGATIQRNVGDASLVSFTAVSNPQVLTRLDLHLAELFSTPLVLHIAVQHDLSDILLLRPAVSFFLLSVTAQEAHDNALLASDIARKEKRVVVHAFYVSKIEETLTEIAEDAVLPFLLAGSQIYTPNERTNGHANGYANGHANRDSGASNITDDVDAAEHFSVYQASLLHTLTVTRRPLRPIRTHGPPMAKTLILTLGRDNITSSAADIAVASLSLIKPLPPSRIVSAIPSSVDRIVVLEQIYRWSLKWTPLYLEIISALQQLERRVEVHSGILGDGDLVTPNDVEALVQKARISPLSLRLQLGPLPTTEVAKGAPHVPKHELTYTKILSHLFGDRLDIVNSPSLVSTRGPIATTPEFALGRVRAQIDLRNELIKNVNDYLHSTSIDNNLHVLLSSWFAHKDDPMKSRSFGDEIVVALETASPIHPLGSYILSLRSYLPSPSRWIIGSDAWSYDLGSSGLHHAIASGLNVNFLILDTNPYTSRQNADPHRRKQDVGLYAMNYGNVYVASVAIYSSYSQVLQSFMEADRFSGPSVIVAYLPYKEESDVALDLLKETKLAVDTGYWPLYRWDPSKEEAGKEAFSLDSDTIKNELQRFLDRQNHLSQLTRSKPQFAAELVSGLGTTVQEARKKRAELAYNDLVGALDSPPLLVLYASDGGAAEKLAKRLTNRAKARGISTTIAVLDSISLQSLAQEEHVIFVTSVAGQGEMPQNGRAFFKSTSAALAKGDKVLSNIRYSIFGMGDSHYWPRPEEAHYYNKAGKDLDARLEKLGGERFAPLGLGDDQDADGPQTGYQKWEPLIWKGLRVNSIELTEAEPDPITNEHIKAASKHLRGTISDGLEDITTGALAPSDTQLTKFHGIYQQDDRDIRDERQAQGVEPAYSFMIRVRMPGGVCTPKQWLQMNQIADEHGNGTFKITTRQTFQFHGVIKKHLKPAIQEINRVLLDTLAACGDVNR